MDGFAPPSATIDIASAVEALARRYGDWLKDKLRLRYGDQAEDLAHEALLRTAAHEAANEVEHHKAFLLKVADNLALDRARRARRERAYIRDTYTVQLRATPPSQEELTHLKKILLALPPELRQVLILTQIKGMTHREVSLLTGVPERTVKDRVRRALVKTQAMRD